MDRYIGLDVAKQSCTLAVVGPSGKQLKQMVVETTGAALVEAVRSIAGKRHLCLEEGTQSAWLCELLRPHVDELVVVVPERKSGSKSDARDAFSLAQDLRLGRIETVVFKGSEKFAPLQCAVRGYGMVVRDIVRIKNRLKAVFRSRGLAPGAEIYSADSWEKWFAQLPADSHRVLAELLTKELDALSPLRDEAEEQLHAEAQRHPVLRLLSTAPGIGPIRAAQILAIVVTPDRFRTVRQFWSYCGLAIVTHSSADWIRDSGKWVRANTTKTRGLTRKRNATLKTVFKGAATDIIERMHSHPLHADYQRSLAAGTKPNLAKLTLARRLAAIVLAMWKHKEVYDPERQKQAKKVA